MKREALTGDERKRRGKKGETRNLMTRRRDETRQDRIGRQFRSTAKISFFVIPKKIKIKTPLSTTSFHTQTNASIGPSHPISVTSNSLA
jgi:hypothetical protein